MLMMERSAGVPGPQALEAKVAEARPTFEGEAEKFLSTIEAAKVRGSYVDPSLGRVTFGSYTEEFLASAVDLRPSTRATYETEYRLYLKPALGSVPIASIRRQDLRTLVADLTNRGVGARTVQLTHQVASRVCGKRSRTA
jgi:predicted trehalose synthase